MNTYYPQNWRQSLRKFHKKILNYYGKTAILGFMDRKNQSKRSRWYSQDIFMEWALQQESLRKAKTLLASEADVSVSVVEKLINGTYPSVPSKDKRDRICRVLRRKEDDVFPLVAPTAKGKRQAS